MTNQERDRAEAEAWLRANDWDYKKYGDRRGDRIAYQTMMLYEAADFLEWAFTEGMHAERKRGEKLREKIAGLCGHPDAAEGCFLILAVLAEYEGKVGGE